MDTSETSSSNDAVTVTDAAGAVVLGVMPVMVGGTLSMLLTVMLTTSDSLLEVSTALKETVAFPSTTTPVSEYAVHAPSPIL